MIDFYGKTHCVIAFAIAFLLIIHSNMELTIGMFFFLLGVAIGSVLPDADHKHTPIGRVVPLWLFFKNRTITHSLIMLILISIIFKISYNVFSINEGFGYMGAGLVLGVLVHILSDIFTPRGCPVWYPINECYISLAKIRVGGHNEYIIRMGSTLIVCLEIIYLIYTII